MLPLLVDCTKITKKEKEKEATHAIKWNKHWGANMYQEMTSFTVPVCYKDRVHKRPYVDNGKY